MDASFLLQQTQTISKALDDSRLAQSVQDPDVQRERAALAELLSAQAARAASLQQFVQREEVWLAVNHVGMEDSGAFRRQHGSPPRSLEGAPPGAPTLPPATAPPGMPLLTGIIVSADRTALAEWGTSIDLAVRARENEAARTFLAIAQSCR